MPPKQNAAGLARDLRHRLLLCMTKISDKDTYLQAVSELRLIIPTLTPDTFSLFINSLSSISHSDRAAVRSAVLNLLATLSSHHRVALSGHLPKLVAAVVKRLRDPDTAVRTSAANAVSSLAEYSLSSTSAFCLLLRPFADSLATEQEPSAQNAAAMCVAAVIESAAVVDTVVVMKMLPKLIKVLRSEGFRAKSAVLAVVRSVIGVSKIGNCNMLRDLVNCVVEFLKCDDWAARKAAAEVLTEIAVVERESLSEMKNSCLKLFESRKFDKVKGVREAMIDMLEAWKEVPDVFDDGSPPPQSQASSRENAVDGRYPSRSKISSAVGSNTPQTCRKQVPLRRASLSDSGLKTTARNRGAADVTGKTSITPLSRKLASKKPSENTHETTDRQGSSLTPAYDDVRTLKPEAKRGIFIKNPSSRVMPYTEDPSEVTLGIDNSSSDMCKHQKDSEDLSLIRKQLVQIENQQSSLMDVLQKFIGSSQDGMRILETRVHGLERALDDISYDLAVSTARMSNVEPPMSSCCLIPGSDFLSSKFWRRPGGHCSPLTTNIHSMANKGLGNGVGLENRKFHLRGPGGVIMNPLADIHSDPRGVSEASSSRISRGIHTAA